MSLWGVCDNVAAWECNEGAMLCAGGGREGERRPDSQAAKAGKTDVMTQWLINRSVAS